MAPDSRLLMRLAAIDPEAALWRRLERYVWPEHKACPDCLGPIVRALAPRSALAHWQCPACEIGFRATRATPLALPVGPSLRAWAWVLAHIAHFKGRFSSHGAVKLLGLKTRLVVGMQQVGEQVLSDRHPIVTVLLGSCPEVVLRISRPPVPAGVRTIRPGPPTTPS